MDMISVIGLEKEEFTDIFAQKLDSDTLFIFPDNVIDHNSACEEEGNPKNQPGPRPYNRHGDHKSHPKTAGIPVAWSPWKPLDYFEEIDDPEVKKNIDNSLNEILELIETHHYKKIKFFAKPKEFEEHPLPIFTCPDIPKEILNYISRKLNALSTPREGGQLRNNVPNPAQR